MNLEGFNSGNLDSEDYYYSEEGYKDIVLMDLILKLINQL
jgi:hypothetical protein